MIEVRELRIGNYVGNNNRTLFVTGILGDKIYYESLKYFTEASNLHPILLTEEWLTKFGFEKTLLKFEGVVFLYNEWKFKVREGLVYTNIGMRSELKYVHQLQNLIFALTGKELVIKKEDLIGI